jgi:hypothetical protein
MNTLLLKVKLALRIKTNAFDDEIADIIGAALDDLGIAGVIHGVTTTSTTFEPLVIRAVTTYAKLHFGDIDTAEYDRLKLSYDEQKAQMSMTTGYTDWLK